ncbi:MAG: efflux RND transporter periplasmic adaptor subunit [Phycisphaerales bacterium]
MDTIRVLGAALVATVLTMLVGCERKAAERPAAPPAEVIVETTVPATLPVEYDFIGQTEASRSVEIRARVQGFLIRQAVKDGQWVKEGEILYEIDPRQFTADTDVAKAKLAQAAAREEKAERDVARLTRLLEADAGQQKNLDDAKTEKLQAVAEKANAQAQLANAELQLSYTTIKAPVSGRVGVSARREGALVDPGSNSYLNTVVQSDPIFVNFTISEREMLNWTQDVKAGRVALPTDGKLTVRVTLGDGSPYPYEGEMDFFDTSIDPSTGTQKVRAEFKNPAEVVRPGGEPRELMLPGQFVRAKIVGWERPNSITVPQRAVVQAPSGPMVLLVTADDKVAVQPVQLGGWHGDRWHVTRGLKGGERVIIDGLVRAQPGSVVRPVTAGAEAQPQTK